MSFNFLLGTAVRGRRFLLHLKARDQLEFSNSALNRGIIEQSEVLLHRRLCSLVGQRFPAITTNILASMILSTYVPRFVPEGHLIIAQGFNLGCAWEKTKVPKGRLNPLLRIVSRPFGTRGLRHAHPNLERVGLFSNIPSGWR